MSWVNLARELENDDIETCDQSRNFDQFPSIKIETDPVAPAHLASALY